MKKDSVAITLQNEKPFSFTTREKMKKIEMEIEKELEKELEKDSKTKPKPKKKKVYNIQYFYSSIGKEINSYSRQNKFLGMFM